MGQLLVVFTHAWDQLFLNHANSKNIVFHLSGLSKIVNALTPLHFAKWR